MSGTISKEWPHLEMGVTYLLAHNCKPAKVMGECVFCQGKRRLIYKNLAKVMNGNRSDMVWASNLVDRIGHNQDSVGSIYWPQLCRQGGVNEP